MMMTENQEMMRMMMSGDGMMSMMVSDSSMKSMMINNMMDIMIKDSVAFKSMMKMMMGNAGMRNMIGYSGQTDPYFPEQTDPSF